MAAELVNAATGEKLRETDWTKNIEICELVARDNRQSKDVIKSIRKRLKNKNPNVQLFAVMLLEMLMNNCGECIHRQVIDAGILPMLVKIVKKKNDFPVRERIFLLLDAMQTSLGGSSGKFPQYYAAYYDLVSAQVEFPQRLGVPSTTTCVRPNADEEQAIPPENAFKNCAISAYQPKAEAVPDSSVMDKATRVLEVLCEVLDAMDPQHPEGASDEFTLDLVEQCSFQKQRLMRLIMTCRDEKMVSRAIELNEKLHGVLSKHDALLSANCTSATSISCVEAEEEEEDADCLLRRLRKGKARVDCQSEISHGSYLSVQDEKPNGINGTYGKPLVFSPLHISEQPAVQLPPPLVSLPPPPAMHTEREKFFKEKQLLEGPGLSGHMRGLSIHSQDGCSSCCSSSDSTDRDPFAHRY